METKCKHEGCELATYRGHKHYCNTHRMQFQRSKTTWGINTHLNQTCSVDGCDRRNNARNMCKSHYNQWCLGRLAENKEDRCEVNGCHLKGTESTGLCATHNATMRAIEKSNTLDTIAQLPKKRSM